MTTKTVTQGGVEVLFRIIPGEEVTQVGVEYLHRVGNAMEMSQAGIEYLHRVLPTITTTQVGIEYLHKAVPCMTRWAQIWIIERTDGEIFRFTSLDQNMDWFGNEYESCDSLVPSASEGVSEVDDAGNMDLSGAVGPAGITEEALFAGLFDGATVEAWLVNWGGEDYHKLLIKGTFGPVETTATGFKVELLGDGAKLMQTPLIRLLQPDCRWEFGDEFCQKPLAPLTVTGTIDSGLGQRQFVDAARVEVAGYFTRGKVTFTTGSNAGISAEIKEHSSGGVFELWPRLAFGISAGDQYSMIPGCTNLKGAVSGCNGCTAWANLPRYGGFDKVPGGDKRTGAADVRQ